MTEIRIRRIRTSTTEIKDIVKACIALSFAFTFLLFPKFYGSGITLFTDFSFAKLFSIDFLTLFLISLFTVGIGFLLHEFAHKLVAQRYGCMAEFRSWDSLICLAVGMAVAIGWVFAALGAVMISGMITRRENGIVSVAGAVTNYVLAFLFFGLSLIYPLFNAFKIGYGINFWLGLFNMIPFGPLDGLKVFHWNKLVWILMVLIGVGGVFFL